MGLAAFIDQNTSVFHGTAVQRAFRRREMGNQGDSPGWQASLNVSDLFTYLGRLL